MKNKKPKKKPKTVTIDSINIDGIEIKAEEPIELETEFVSFEEALEDADITEKQREMFKNMWDYFRDDNNFK